jgi:hypothetical protein
MEGRVVLPDGNHVVVHPFQLFLRRVEGVGWGVKLVGLETLVGEVDLEWLVLFLQDSISSASIHSIASLNPSSGTRKPSIEERKQSYLRYSILIRMRARRIRSNRPLHQCRLGEC